MPKISSKRTPEEMQRIANLAAKYPPSEWDIDRPPLEELIGSLMDDVIDILIGERACFGPSKRELDELRRENCGQIVKPYPSYRGVGLSAHYPPPQESGRQHSDHPPLPGSTEERRHCNAIPSNTFTGLYYPLLLVVCNDGMNLDKTLGEMCDFLYLSDGTTVRVEFFTSHWSRVSFFNYFTKLEDLCKKYQIDFNFRLFSDFGLKRIPLPPRFY